MPVLLEHREDGVAIVTLDDATRRNAMTASMGASLGEVCDTLERNSALRAVVLTGTPPAFSAGGDLEMLEDLATRTRQGGFDPTATMRTFYDRFLRIRDLPVPVLAAINGHAIGAGLCVALACDLRIVAEEAKVGLNFARLGLHPGMGATWLLPRTLGSQRAAAWLYTGAILDGREAAAQGLALEAVPGAEVLDRALAIAGDIASASPLVVRHLKATLATTETLDLDAALDREAAAQAVSYASDDLQEGLRAARERRAPDFPGR